MPSATRRTTSFIVLLLAGVPGVVALGGSQGWTAGQVSAADAIRRALPALVSARRADLSPRAGLELTTLYEMSAGGPIWVDSTGRPNGQARTALGLLGESSNDALLPADYGTAELSALAGRLGGAAPAPATAATFEVLLSVGVLRYFRHLHIGRIDPRAAGFVGTVPEDDHDFADIVWNALAGNRLAEAATDLTPPLTHYRALRARLAHYRALSAAATDDDVPAFTGTVRPGDVYPGLATLHRLLVTVGDLPPDAPLPPSGLYDEPTHAGVVRFQERHGLAPDGVIGRATQAALRVPLSWRVRQIELALERLRWLPDLSRGRFVAVNIPMFRLWAWDHGPADGAPAVTMAVIVGRALGTETPALAKSLEHVIFRPYWNVPASILRNEMLPILRRDPEYLDRQNLEMVQGPGDNAAVLPPTPENIARLGREGVRLRQRPGPTNALGRVKFVFPNDDNVYMHDTPAPLLFRQARRDLSHGCIRVADPAALAEWVLAGDPVWTRDRILAAMNGAWNRRVDLLDPIQVVVFYSTALVAPEDGAMRFADDIYGQDAALDEALMKDSGPTYQRRTRPVSTCTKSDAG